jgi:hypothetical protein
MSDLMTYSGADGIASRRVRPCAVAGRFYPGDAEELRRTVRALLDSVVVPVGPAPKAIIVPHAGYIFSGPIAASAYARLAVDRDHIRRIVLLGPSHREAFDGLAASTWDAFATPLGLVPLDGCALPRLAALPQVVANNAAHAGEHALEVQLPFLQCALREDFTLVPLLAGETTAEAISQVLEALWGGEETRLVISSDLSHYYESSVARRLDAATADAIEALAPERIEREGACGRLGIQGLLEAAKHHHLHASTVDLRNSGDTAGQRQQVVGYGAFAFGP